MLDEFDDELLDELELELELEFEFVLLEFELVLFELLRPTLPEGAVGGGGGVVGCRVAGLVAGLVVGATIVVVDGIDVVVVVVVVDVLVGVSAIGGGVSPSSSSARIVPVAIAASPRPPIAPARYAQDLIRIGRMCGSRSGPAQLASSVTTHVPRST